MYNVESFDDLDNFIIENNDKVILLYFGATWCGPCKQLKERLCDEESIQQLPLLKICYIDVDQNEEITSHYQIKSLPTQIFVRLSKKKVKVVSKIEGYDYTKLILEYETFVNNFHKKN